MSVILDTHVFFWWVTGSDSLPARHRALLEASEETIYVSALSGWEIAIKVKIGRWPDVAALIPNLEQTIVDEGLKHLDVSMSQAKLAGCLDLVHRDPFDRLLAAQSILLQVPIATVDPASKRLAAEVI